MNGSRRTVLVTGGTGTLDSAFAARWLAHDGEVVVLDRGDLAAGLVEREAAPKLIVAQGDARDDELVRRWVERCDLVIHLAAGGVGDLASPEEVLDAHFLGTRTVLRACVEAARPVVLASSSEVYGRSAGLLHEQSPRNLGSDHTPRSSRAIGSLAAEEYAIALGRRGLRYIIARYFNVYGPGIDQPGTGGVIGRFAGCIRDRKPLGLVDGGRAVRSFCFVDDAVEATALLAESLLRSDALVGRTFNVGRNEPVSIAQLAEQMVRLTNHGAGVISVSGEQLFGNGYQDIAARVPDVTALRAAVEFESRTSLDSGLRKTLAHCELLASTPSPAPAATDAERVPWVRPIFESDESLFADIRVALSTGRVTNDGPHLREFERQLASYLGVDDCVAVSSGSAALLLATWALGLQGGKAVIPSFTFLATLNALVHSGLTPVFCDIEPDTWTLSPKHLERLLAEDPTIRLVVPVNVFGVPPDLRAIHRVVDGTDAALMLDNAHGLGTQQAGVRCPPEAPVQAYSFHATKTLPAVEGGAVVASDRRLLSEIRRLRNHGVASDPLASTPGYNAKMSELHAAVGLRSLRALDAALARRRQYAERLRRVLIADCAGTFTVQVVPDTVQSNFQNLGVLCHRGNRANVTDVQAALDRHGIETRRYFWPPLHQLPAYRGRFSLPTTDAVGEAILCLPLHSWMEPSMLDRIEAALRQTAPEVR